METTKLYVLKEVVEIGSLRKAAEKLGYTQPALTAMMNSLEADLNIPLLKRDRRGVYLTNEGQELMPYIVKILSAEEDFNQKLRNYVPSRSLSIGCFQAMAVYVLPKYIRMFKELYPDVNIELQISSMDMHKQIDSYSIDFGITDTYNSAGYTWTPLMKDTIYATVPTSSPLAFLDAVSIEEFLKYPVIIPSENPNSFVKRILNGYEIPNHIDIGTSSANTMMLLVSQGLGITLLSGLLQPDLPLNVKMLPLNPNVERDLGIVCKNFEALSPLAKEFIQMIQKGNIAAE